MRDKVLLKSSKEVLYKVDGKFYLNPKEYTDRVKIKEESKVVTNISREDYIELPDDCIEVSFLKDFTLPPVVFMFNSDLEEKIRVRIQKDLYPELEAVNGKFLSGTNKVDIIEFYSKTKSYQEAYDISGKNTLILNLYLDYLKGGI